MPPKVAKPRPQSEDKDVKPEKLSARKADTEAGGKVKKQKVAASPADKDVAAPAGEAIEPETAEQIRQRGDEEYAEAVRKYDAACNVVDAYEGSYFDYSVAYELAVANLQVFNLKNGDFKADYVEQYKVIKQRTKLLDAVIKAAEKYARKEKEYAKAFKLADLRGEPYRHNFPKDKRPRTTYRLRPGQPDPRRERGRGGEAARHADDDDDARSEITYDSDYTVILESEMRPNRGF